MGEHVYRVVTPDRRAAHRVVARDGQIQHGASARGQPALRLREQHARQRPKPPDRRMVRDRRPVVVNKKRPRPWAWAATRARTRRAPARRIGARAGAGAGAGGGDEGGVVGVVVFTRAFARQPAPRGVIPILEFTGRSDRLIFASYEFGDDFFRGISGRVAPWSLRRPAGDIPGEISG